MECSTQPRSLTWWAVCDHLVDCLVVWDGRRTQDMVVGLDASWPDLDSKRNNLIVRREITLSLVINSSCRVVVSCMRHVESVVGNWTIVAGKVLPTLANIAVVGTAHVAGTWMQKCSATAHQEVDQDASMQQPSFC